MLRDPAAEGCENHKRSRSQKKATPVAKRILVDCQGAGAYHKCFACHSPQTSCQPGWYQVKVKRAGTKPGSQFSTTREPLCTGDAARSGAALSIAGQEGTLEPET